MLFHRPKLPLSPRKDVVWKPLNGINCAGRIAAPQRLLLCSLMFYSAVLRPLCHWRISSQVDQLPRKVTPCHRRQRQSVELFDKALVSGNSWRWETFGMLRECEEGAPVGWSAFLAQPSSSGPLLGDWQAIVSVSRWKGPYLKGHSLALQSLRMESKWHDAPYCCIKEICPSLVKPGAWKRSPLKTFSSEIGCASRWQDEVALYKRSAFFFSLQYAFVFACLASIKDKDVWNEPCKRSTENTLSARLISGA